MTDEELVLKKLAFIETCVRELRELADVGRLDEDIKERRFIEHSLQVAIQAALDVASHIVSDERLGEPSTNRQLFAALSSAGYVNATLCAHLEAATGFRNIVVHGYGDVNLAVMRDFVEHHLDELLEFCSSIRAGVTGTASR